MYACNHDVYERNRIEIDDPPLTAFRPSLPPSITPPHRPQNKPQEAAQAFDKAAQEMYESPILNFLPDGSVNPDRKKRLAAQKLKPGFAGL